jgi:hypothetical protein
MIPPIPNGSHTLPAGVHECTLEDIEQCFCNGEERRRLFAKLRDIHQIARRCGFLRLIIWGSFATTKSNPEDIDLFITTSSQLNHSTLHSDCKDLLDHGRAEARWGFTVLTCPYDGILYTTIIEGLGYDRSGAKQGLLSITLS